MKLCLHSILYPPGERSIRCDRSAPIRDKLIYFFGWSPITVSYLGWSLWLIAMVDQLPWLGRLVQLIDRSVQLIGCAGWLPWFCSSVDWLVSSVDWLRWLAASLAPVALPGRAVRLAGTQAVKDLLLI